MSPREIIKRNLEFAGPERIGMAFGGEGQMKDFIGARAGPSATYKPRRFTEGKFEYYDDEWGNLWRRIAGMSAGGEIYKPAIADWSMLKDFKLPDMADPKRFEPVKKTFEQGQEHYRSVSLPGFPFGVCRCLRKMENYFQDLVLERKNIDYLHDMVATLLEEMIKNFAAAGADGVFFCEDWGTQERLLISPEMWREIFKPLFKRLCTVAHDNGLHVMMHSCGYNRAILDDLAEAGINCFQFDQPALYGLEWLSRKLRDLKVCLFSPVDIQRVLPTGNRDLIVSEARKMVKLFGGRNGGFIATTYGDLKGIGVEPEWAQWAYEVFLEAKDNNWCCAP